MSSSCLVKPCSWTRCISSAATALAIAAVLSACGEKSKSPTQVAAKVNKEEISVHQINFLLSRQHGVKPDEAQALSRQILERLIDQEFALQKAHELKVDRDPAVLQALDAARRDIISRAYLDRVSETATRPTADDVKKYFDEKPALFSERRVYQLHEFSVEANPAQIQAVRTQLMQTKSAGEFAQYLRSKDIRFAANQSVRPAEQLPLSAVDAYAKMKDGQAILTPTGNGAEIVFVISSQTVPVDEAGARPAIHQFLLNERKRKIVEKDIKLLREAGKIEYAGQFASPGLAADGASAVRADAVK